MPPSIRIATAAWSARLQTHSASRTKPGLWRRNSDLLQNTQTRSDHAIQTKLNAIADGLADLMSAVGDGAQLSRDRAQLLSAVGLEDRESTG